MSIPGIDFKASPNHSVRDGAQIEMIVIHATVGSYASSLNWLRNPVSRVSTHYLIRKDGLVTQLVADDRAAWHAGTSAWRGMNSGAIQHCSIGIELENANDGHDPYPAAQLTATRALCQILITRYGILRGNVVRHLDIAIPKGRKTDPAGLDWPQFADALFPPVAPVAVVPLTDITADALLLHAPRATEAQCVAALTRRPTGGYPRSDVAHIVACYYATGGGVDPLLAIAQMAHETGFLSSWWAQRPRRNPAGIGVTGVAGAGLRFASWELAVAAHIGRLLAYALPDGAGNAAQKALITRALALRPMPLAFRGVASRLRGLNGRWAVPGTDYADKIAAIASAIRGPV